MSEERNQAAVPAYFDAIERGDRAALLALFRPDTRWRVPNGAVSPCGGLHEGAERVVDLMLGVVGAAFAPDTQRVEIGPMLARGEPGGAPDYEDDYVFVSELASDGRIAELREHVDTRSAALAFGGA